MHLTNYSINKDNTNYKQGDGEDGVGGSKRSMSNVFKIMEDNGVDIQKLQGDIEDVIVKTFIAI